MASGASDDLAPEAAAYIASLEQALADNENLASPKPNWLSRLLRK